MQPQKANLSNEKTQQRIDQVKSFKRWITHEVLPAIRKTGSYTSKNGSFPWLDSMGATLRRESKLTKDLSRPERLRLRAGMLRQTQEETGHNYTDIISILEKSADNQEQKIIQLEERKNLKEAEAEARAARTNAREEARTITGQTRQLLAWIKEAHAVKGDKFALVRDEFLLVRYQSLKMWAARHKLNLTEVLRELHRQGVIEAFDESGKIRYGYRGTRINGEQVSMVWVRREAIEKEASPCNEAL